MTPKRIREHKSRQPHSDPRRLEVPQSRSEHSGSSDEVFGLWLTFAQAARYVGSKNVRAFYAWRRAHGVVARNNSTVSRRDLDRVLRVPRARRVMAPASLANLGSHKRAQLRESLTLDATSKTAAAAAVSA